MRQMVGQRKGGAAKPAIVIAIGKKGDEPEAVDNATEEADEPNDGRPQDVVKCPSCGAEINTITGKLTTDDGSEPDGTFGKGKLAESLDETDSQYNKPGPFGAASDAARGSEAETKSLGSLRG